MKIFNKENDKEVVYVQKGDLAYMMHLCNSVPVDFFNDYFYDIVIINDDNRNEFVRFTKPNEVSFLKKQDWIIDYRDYKDLPEYEIKFAGEDVVKEINKTVEIFNNSKSDKERSKLHNRYEQLEYKFDGIKELLWYKQGHVKYDIPVVPDSEGFSFTGDSNVDYVIGQGLEPNKLLLYRKDGKQLSGSDKIPKGFIEMAMSIALAEKSNDAFVKGNYETENYFTEDNQYMVTEFKVKKIEKEQHTEEKNEVVQEQQNKENSIKRFVKKIFKGRY